MCQHCDEQGEGERDVEVRRGEGGGRKGDNSGRARWRGWGQGELS